jgi:hypothetical protein
MKMVAGHLPVVSGIKFQCYLLDRQQLLRPLYWAIANQKHIRRSILPALNGGFFFGLLRQANGLLAGHIAADTGRRILAGQQNSPHQLPKKLVRDTSPPYATMLGSVRCCGSSCSRARAAAILLALRSA